jgi:hypothetical protein
MDKTSRLASLPPAQMVCSEIVNTRKGPYIPETRERWHLMKMVSFAEAYPRKHFHPA